MKKTLLSALMLSAFGVFTTSAQITITDANLVSVGEDVYQGRDTLPTSFTIGSSGASQVWNYATVAEDLLDTMKFRAPSGYPGAVDFPTSNMVIVEPEADSAWTYLTKNSTGLYINGQAQYNQGNLISLPLSTTIITFPSTMGTTYSGSWSGLIFAFPLGQDVDGPGPQGMIDSLKITRGSSLSSSIDAWGDVTTPFATFASLRQIIVEESIDTTWQLEAGNWSVISATTIAALTAAGFPLDQYAYDTTRTARWWSDDITARFPVMEMDYEADGTVNSIDWLKTSPVTGIAKTTIANAVLLYPNPASTEITITTDLTNKGLISILDVTGKLIKDIRFNSNRIKFSVSDLDNGIYFYNVYDADGNVLHSNKFIVAK